MSRIDLAKDQITQEVGIASTGNIKLDLKAGRTYNEDTPATGDITVDTSDSVIGGIAVKEHNDSVEPNIIIAPTDLTRNIIGSYVTGVLNEIWFLKKNSKININYVQPTVVPADIIAPTFSSAPTAVNITETSFDITTQLNENGVVYGYLLANGSTAPTIQEIIDNAQSQFTDSGSGGTLSFTGLTLDTNYDVHVVAEDIYGNRQANSVKVDVLTAGGISAEAQVVINRMTSPSSTEQNAIANFVDTLVASGDWGLIDEFQFNQMDSEINSLVGWKGIANATNNSATWGKTTGFVLNGSNAWINTNLNPSTQTLNYTTTSSFLGFGLTANRNQNANIQHALSTRDVNVNSILLFENPEPSIEFRVQSNSASDYNNVNTFPVGNILTKRIGTTITVSLNNVVGTPINATISTDVPNNPLALGAYNNNGTIQGFFNGDFSYFIIGGSGINFTNIHNAINQLKNDLGV